MTPKLYVDEGKGDGEAPARRGVGRSTACFRFRRKDEVKCTSIWVGGS